VIGDPRPLLDDCVASNPKFQTVNQITVSGKNVGDLLNAKGHHLGWFQVASRQQAWTLKDVPVCGQHHTGLAGDDAVVNAGDYIPRPRTISCTISKPPPAPSTPSSPALSAKLYQANHQYDLKNFFTALKEGRLQR